MHQKTTVTALCAVLALSANAGCASDETDETESGDPAGAEQPLWWQQWQPGIRVLPMRTLTTSEVGGSTTVWISLRSPPRSSVRVSVETREPDEVRVVPEQLVFNQLDWWFPRKVTVSGLSDLLLDGDAPFELTLHADSSDPRYAALDPVVLRGINRDEATFHGLADESGGLLMSRVSDLSVAGDVAVGTHADGGAHAARWAPDTQLQLLAGSGSRAGGVSPDGKLVVGSIPDARYPRGSAVVLWRTPTSQPELYQEPPVQPQVPLVFVAASAVTNDGQAYGTCEQYGGYLPLGCRTPIDFGNLLSPASTIASISPDGSAWVGSEFPNRYMPYVQYAVLNGARLPYPDELDCLMPDPCDATAEDVSDVGGIVVGTIRLRPTGSPDLPETPYQDSAFVYDDRWTRLPDLNGGAEISGAHALSADGTVIGGFGSDDGGSQAVIWRAGQPSTVRSLLAAAGVQVPDGWQLNEVVALSSDARTIVGNGVNPSGQPQAWRALLPTR